MSSSEFDDPAFLDQLRQGDPVAFGRLVRRWHNSLVSVASAIIGSRAQGEEVVQDAWLAVFSGINRFEGRSSLTTWVFRIVLNRARTRISRETRLVGLPSILDGSQGHQRAVDSSEFKPDGHWIEAPRLWDELSPERVLAGRQLWEHVQDVIEALPAGQRAVITLRDMEGLDAEETCQLLAISSENQRVLLHRARGRIRKAVDELVSGAPGPAAVARRKPATRSGQGPLARLAAMVARICRAPLLATLAGGTLAGIRPAVPPSRASFASVTR